MKKFLFRLETLLKLRSFNERKTQKELFFQNQKQSQLEAKKKTLEKQILQLSYEIHEKREVRERSMEETYAQILDHLNFSLKQVLYALDCQEKLIQETQERLKQLIQQRKVIEKIREKHYSHWKKQTEQLEEVDLLDEFSRRPK